MEARRFRDKNTLEQRSRDTRKVKDKYSGKRIPCFASRRDERLPAFKKSKYLVDRNLTISQFTGVVRSHLQFGIKPVKNGIRTDSLSSGTAVFCLLAHDNTMPCGAHRIAHYYETHQDEDGFLYFIFTAEETFGSKGKLKISV
jgi:GABA(A) receptor-associated protein